MSKYKDNSDGFTEGQTGKRPEFITDEHLEFLDDLRESGACNMFGAGRYVRKAFKGLTEKEATTILSYWMKTFSQRHAKATE